MYMHAPIYTCDTSWWQTCITQVQLSCIKHMQSSCIKHVQLLNTWHVQLLNMCSYRVSHARIARRSICRRIASEIARLRYILAPVKGFRDVTISTCSYDTTCACMCTYVCMHACNVCACTHVCMYHSIYVFENFISVYTYTFTCTSALNNVNAIVYMHTCILACVWTVCNMCNHLHLKQTHEFTHSVRSLTLAHSQVSAHMKRHTQTGALTSTSTFVAATTVCSCPIFPRSKNDRAPNISPVWVWVCIYECVCMDASTFSRFKHDHAPNASRHRCVFALQICVYAFMFCMYMHIITCVATFCEWQYLYIATFCEWQYLYIANKLKAATTPILLYMYMASSNHTPTETHWHTHTHTHTHDAIHPLS